MNPKTKDLKLELTFRRLQPKMLLASEEPNEYEVEQTQKIIKSVVDELTGLGVKVRPSKGEVA